ncbi:hypothetical protein BH09ACT1_BH09ACT1_22910 [soil metagenome]
MNINASMRGRVVTTAIAAVALIGLGVPLAAIAHSARTTPDILGPGTSEPHARSAGPYARVFGRVFNAVTDDPLPDAQVNFNLVGTSSAFEAVAAVNADGTYSETRIAPGTYFVTFSMPDGSFAPAVGGPGNQALVTTAPIELSAGIDRKGVDGALAPAFTLRGKVSGLTKLNEALQAGNGHVALFTYDPDAGAWNSVGGNYPVDDKLRYSIPGVIAGIYKVQVVINGQVVTQMMDWSDQPSGPLSRELEVGGTAVTVHDLTVVPAE